MLFCAETLTELQIVGVRRTLVLSRGSWSPNSTDLYFWYLFVELAVATPVEWRNFVSVVPAAKKSQLGPIFFSKYPCYIQTVCEKARNRTKNLQKKGVFISSSDQLAEPGHKSWSEGLIKTPFFGGFLPVFCPVSCFFTDNLCMKCLFCKKNRPIWPSLAVEAPVTKFRHV